MSDASGSIATAMGTVKGWRAAFYNETVLKQVTTLSAPENLAKDLEAAKSKLTELKGKAAVLTMAGSAVQVWWDVVDMKTAQKEGDELLRYTYKARVVTGAGTIGATVAGVFFLRKPRSGSSESISI